MLADAFLDLTNRGEIVIDPFLGSGSTLIAAERTGRSCRGIELDPLYIDVILRRYQTETGQSAILGRDRRNVRPASREALEAGAVVLTTRGGDPSVFSTRCRARCS